MDSQSQGEMRALDAQCRAPASSPSRTAVVKLKALPAAGQTHCIARYAQLDLPHLVRCALAAGVSADARWGEDDTPVLCLAAERGSSRALQALLDGRANVALSNKKGWTAAHKAAFYGHAPCLRLLLAAGGAPKEAKTNQGSMPLHLAAQEGHAECCSVLIASGCGLDTRSTEQFTPLYFASQLGRLAVICLLLDAGAQLEVKGGDNRTALAIAAVTGCVEAVKLLLARGANPNAVENGGYSPLMGAALTKHTACVRALLPVSDLSITNHQGRTVFHDCIAMGDMECFELLLPLMSDVDVRTVQGVSADGSPETHTNSTPLHLACSFGQHDMVKALLRRGALRTARASDKRTPLQEASLSGHLSCVSTLLGKPNDYLLTPDEVNATDVVGWTPLHHAAASGHANICGALLKAGARLNAVLSSGHTPLQLVQQEHPSNKALIDLLAGRGPEHPPGTVCDGCGIPEVEAWGAKLHACSGCLLARYCGKTCSRAAWPAHRAECGRLKTAREERCTQIPWAEK